jgi:hypothetical protein
MQIPVNRWTVGAAVALIAWLGGDFMSSIFQVLQVLVSINSPAL